MVSGVQHDTDAYGYVKSLHFFKLLSVSTCQDSFCIQLELTAIVIYVLCSTDRVGLTHVNLIPDI